MRQRRYRVNLTLPAEALLALHYQAQATGLRPTAIAAQHVHTALRPIIQSRDFQRWSRGEAGRIVEQEEVSSETTNIR